MVKFVGGPSVNAYKNYRNHTIARPGQFRMPRNYGSVTNKTTIIVRNYNQCNCGPKMNWLAAMPMFGDLLKGILDLFKKPEPVVEPKVEETTIKPKEETVVKTEEPEKTEKPVTPTPIIEGNIFSDEKVEGGKEAKKLTTTILDAEMYTIRNKSKDRTVTKNGTTVTQKAYNAPLWQTLGKSYTTTTPDGKTKQLKITPEFQKFFINKYLKGDEAKVWDLGKDQEFITELEWKGETYTFNAETFKNKANWDLYWVDEKGKNQVGTTEADYSKAEAGTKKETWTASTSFKLDANNDGDFNDAGDINLTFNATSTTSADDVKKQLEEQINKSTLTKDQKASTIAHLGTLTVKKNQ